MRRAGRGRRAPLPRDRGDRGAGPRPLAGRRPSPSLLALVATGLLSVLLSASLGRSLQEIMETARPVRAGQPVRAHPGAAARTSSGELARIINQSADQLQGRMAEIARDRGRTDAILSAMDDGVLAVDHRGTVILANPSLARAMDLRDALGRHYLEVIRQREVGSLIEEVLRTGERARGRGGAPPAAARLHDHGRALPRRVGNAARRDPDLQRRDRAAPARAHPARLRGQRLPRAAHAAHLDPRLRGGARGRRGRGAGEGPALPGQDPHPRRPDGRPRGGPARAEPPRVGRPRAGVGGDAAVRGGGGRGGLLRRPGDAEGHLPAPRGPGGPGGA